MEKKALIREFIELVPLLVSIAKKNRKVQNERISFGDNKEQYALLSLPEKEAKKNLVVYIHGGSFRYSNAQFHRFIGKFHADRGFVHLNLNYRKVPKFRYPTPVEDVFRGLKRGLEELQSRGYAFEGIVVGGSSAGAYLATMICCNTVLREKYGLNAYNIKGLYSLAGLLNIKRYPNAKWLSKDWFYEKAMKDFFVGKEDNPLDYLTEKQQASLLLLHGKQDPLVSIEDNQAFFAAYQGEKRMYEIPDFLHSDVCVAPFLYDREEQKNYLQWLNQLENQAT